MEARKTIFVASSHEARDIAEKVVEALFSKNLIALPWWDSFEVGKYTVDQLSQHARLVDGAIFLATKDDKIWSSKGEQDAPRDNILLEFGMFVAHLGLQRTVIIAEPEVKLPSDLHGVTYQLLRGEVAQIADKVAAHFTKTFRGDRKAELFSTLKVICHPELATHQVASELPQPWLMRSMYLGTEGARAWLGVAKDPNYPYNTGREFILHSILNLLRFSETTFRTFVTLGPGDGALDKAIALALLEREPTIECIPVDLSDGLLWEAIRLLSECIRIPVGLLADFEDKLSFVSHHVKQNGKGPYLYSLLGNTFGNLDGSEQTFAQGLRSIMQEEDAILLDVALLKADKKLAKPNLASWSAGMKLFFAQGAARSLHLSVNEVLSRFDELIDVEVWTKGNSIKDSVTVNVRAEKKTFARTRRYDLVELIKFFESRGFRVKSERIGFEGMFDSCVIVLQI